MLLSTPSGSASTLFSYDAPRITSVYPSNGPTGGGTQVVLNGQNFGLTGYVRLGISNCTVISSGYSQSSIACTTPAGVCFVVIAVCVCVYCASVCVCFVIAVCVCVSTVYLCVRACSVCVSAVYLCVRACSVCVSTVYLCVRACSVCVYCVCGCVYWCVRACSVCVNCLCLCSVCVCV